MVAYLVNSLITMPYAWLASIFSLSGSLLIAKKKRIGFYVMIISNFCWVAFAYNHDVLPLAIIDTVYFLINCFGLYYWKKSHS